MSLDRAEVREMIQEAISAERKRILKALEAVEVPRREHSDEGSYGNTYWREDECIRQFKNSLIDVVKGQQ
jgi:hypothetical protein